MTAQMGLVDKLQNDPVPGMRGSHLAGITRFSNRDKIDNWLLGLSPFARGAGLPIDHSAAYESWSRFITRLVTGLGDLHPRLSVEGYLQQPLVLYTEVFEKHLWLGIFSAPSVPRVDYW